MKSLIKVSLLASTIALALNTSSALAADTAPSAIQPATTVPASSILNKFKSSEDQTAYALGASLGHYMNNSMKEQEKLGIKLDKGQMISGVQDAFGNNNKLSDKEIEATLQSFEEHVKQAAKTKMEQEAKDNAAKGDKYREDYAKQKGVKKTTNGVLYKVDKAGIGSAPTNSDTVVVNYKGALVDGTEFDNSYKRSEPLSFRLDGVIPGWTEGLKHIKKGGKIHLVLPPEQAYGKTDVPGIPANSTLVFDIDLLDIKPATGEDGQAPDVGAQQK
ncbi:MAG: FKBP-type peptidyl-prolyl cis-trans isomerase FkpA [Sodalis sp.]|uniref:FKBP-type peptidyl-prolyl cis-trans isomerase n=1 Tax=Sodalis sp. (in: enterobacteria) TaxID=1898979 RepID=UPI003873AEBD|nr:MAG: FKBP-type peptidyl-prolyl cis-trans isomerase FkpA [Sodalis sp.]